MIPETEKLNYRYRCPEKEKYADDCKLAKKIMDEIIPTFTRSKDWVEEFNNDLSSYKLYNNDISQEDFEQVCNPLGIDVGQYDEEVLPYNKTYTKIDVLLGEEYKRGTNFILALMNAKALEEKDEELKSLYLAYIQEIVEKNERIIEAQQQGLPESEIQKIRDEVTQSKTPEDIEKISFMSEMEILGNHVLNYGMYKEDVRSIKNDAFKHALLSDKEFVYVGVNKGEPKIRLCNTLNTFYSKTPNIKYIQDGDYAGEISVMSAEKIIEQYGHVLSKEDLEKLRKRVPGYSGKQYTGQLEYNVQDTITNQYLNSIASMQYIGRNIGNYSDDINANKRLLHDTFCTVVSMEWKWLREICFITKKDDYNQDVIDIIDGDYEIPEDATKVKFINRFGEKSEKYEWTDINGNYVCIEKMWIPRVWEGIRIDNDIYINIREKPFQPYSIDNPFDIELGYYGCIFNSMNAKPISLMARMKPFQFLFFVVLHQIKQLIPKTIGPIQNFDTSMVDPNLAGNDSEDPYTEALSKTFYYRQKGLNIYNSMINNIGGQPTQTNISRPQPGSVQNMSIGQDLNNLLQLLGWLDIQIGLAAGVSQQREAQFSSNTNVTDNQQAIVQSSHITEHYFRKHNELWKKIMEAYINYAKIAWKDKKIKRQYLLSDLSLQMLEIKDINKFINSDMGLFVTDSGKEFEYINNMADMAKMMVQNGASIQTVSYILKARAQGTSPEEIHKMITKLQTDAENKAQQSAQAEQENAKQIQQMQLEAREDEQQHEIELEKMRIEGNLAKAEIDATRFKQAQDVNDNQIPDIMEVAKLKLESDKHQNELTVKEKELDIKKKELELKENDITTKNNLKNKEIDVKAQTERYKALKTSQNKNK